MKNLLLAIVSVAAGACADPGAIYCNGVTGPCKGFAAGASESSISAAFATATPGTTIAFGPGSYLFTNTLACATTATNLTVQGAGKDVTILDFSTQTGGSQGIYCASNGFKITGLTVKDTPGDAIKTEGATGVTFDNIHVTWTSTNLGTHGAYGVYPVQCQNVLIQDSAVEGASDTGFYIGQSQNVIVRRNTASLNVAGIEIENTWYADVTENTATQNTGGILVFSLPIMGSPNPNSKSVRVYNNTSTNNNNPSFAAPGSIVGMVPSGVGILVMAADTVEVFGNHVENNGTAQTAVVSYLVVMQSWVRSMLPSYPIYPSNVWIHDNTYVAGTAPPDGSNPLGILLNETQFPGGLIPTIMWDGLPDDMPPSPPVDVNNPQNICISGNGSATWANLHVDQIGTGFSAFDMDATHFTCMQTALPPANVPGS